MPALSEVEEGSVCRVRSAHHRAGAKKRCASAPYGLWKSLKIQTLELRPCFTCLGGGFPSEFVKPFTLFLSKEGRLSFFIFPLPGLVPLRLGLDRPGPTAHLQAVTHLPPVKAFGWALQALEAGQQQFFAV